MMLDVDGYEVTRMIRTEYGSRVVLIAVTGYGQPKDKLRSTDAGFDCHFVKPVSVADLVEVLEQHALRGK